MAALRGINRGLGILRIGILARLLTPDQFGVFGIGLLVLGFLEITTETGINVFLIQEENLTSKYLNSAWVVSIIRGILISILIIIAAPYLAGFFNSPKALRLLLLTSTIPLIRGLINPAQVKFQKNLQFNKLFIKDSFLFLIESIVAISVGIITASETALIWGMIVSALIEVVISFIIFKPRPRLAFEFRDLSRVVNRGKWVTAAGIFEYLFSNLDDVVVGKLLGTFSLGLYQNAYKISSVLVLETQRVFNTVTFPVYTSISTDIRRLKKAFFTTTSIIALLIFPLGVVFIVFSKQLILIVLGENWLAANEVLKVLVIYGVIKAFTNSTYSLFLALKMQKIVSIITFITALGLVLTIVPLVSRYGVMGAAMAAIFGTFCALPPTLYYLRKVFVVRD